MDYKLHDHQADRYAAYDLALEAMREKTHVTGYELFEQLPFLTDAQLLESGVPQDLIRISVGLEDIEDILWDLDQSLTTATGGSR
jgi:cystathionine beta-lyase/cystathionine gamma-synthase